VKDSKRRRTSQIYTFIYLVKNNDFSKSIEILIDSISGETDLASHLVLQSKLYGGLPIHIRFARLPRGPYEDESLPLTF
jgi:hypothetical protein